MKSTPLYRAIMLTIEARRLELGVSMSTVDDAAGTNDGYYAKCLYPDTPSGKCAGWGIMQEYVHALFGREFEISLIAADGAKPTLLGIDKGQSHKYLEYRHWRHLKHFKKMGQTGGRHRIANLAMNGDLSAAQRKAAKARWRKVRAAKRQGRAHREKNASAKV